MTTKDVLPSEYNQFYKSYIDNANHLTLKEGLRFNLDRALNFLERIPQDKFEYRYQEGKWTIKEIIQHLIDTERIFAYRALCIAREDQTSFPGFDQDAYILPSAANKRDFEALVNEYRVVRNSSIALFDSFNTKMLQQIGTASNYPISVRAIGFIIMGHENHHCAIISERYL